MAADAVSNPLATYDFSGAPPYTDRHGFLPELRWTSKAPELPGSRALRLDGNSWLSSQTSALQLVKALQATRQFSLRVVCAPAEVRGSDGRIVSISQRPRLINLSVRQENGNLVFWFRNPLTARRDELTWVIPDVFVLHQSRDILFAYDGSNLTAYIDGKKSPRVYELTAGTGLAQLVRHIKTNELEGYTYIYYALLFVPAGALLGIVARKLTLKKLVEASALVIGLVVPAILFELIAIWISGRIFSPGKILFSILLAIGGAYGSMRIATPRGCY